MTEHGSSKAAGVYSGEHDGKLTRHDMALVENANLPPPPARLRPPGDSREGSAVHACSRGESRVRLPDGRLEWRHSWLHPE